MKKAPKKQSLTKNEIVPIQTEDQMFVLYCNGTSISEIARRNGLNENSLHTVAKRLKWSARKTEIQNAIRNDLDEQIKISKKNEAMVGLMIKKLNTKRIMKEYEAYQKKGRKPSFVGTNTSEYQANLHLGDVLMEGEHQKINVNVQGKIKHDVRNYSPEQVDRILDVLIAHKGIPDSPLDPNE